MTSRYYQETPCPECGRWEAHNDSRCSLVWYGPLRTELYPATPNYEAAWDSYYGLANRRRESGLVEMQVRQVVDAALAGVLLLQELE